MKKIKEWWNRRSSPMKAAINSTWQAFVGVFGVSLLGFFHDVAEWAGDTAHEFPSVSPLGKAAVAGLSAAATFLVTFAYRSAKTKNPIYPPAT